MMGVTFASVGPMLSMAAAPFVSRLLPLFPPVVTGTIVSDLNGAPPRRGYGKPMRRNPP